MFAQNMACFAFARRIKERNPTTTIVIGGANCEMPMGQEIVQQVKDIDFVFSGPGLETFPRFVSYYLHQEKERCHTIDGVFSRLNCREYTVHEESPAVVPLQSIQPFGKETHIDTRIELNYDDFLNTYERNFPDKEVEPVLTFETSRGCWWGERSHCTFCGLNGSLMNYRAMGPEKAIELIRSLFKYAPRCSSLESVDNILPRSYIKTVLPFLKPPPPLSISYEVKASLSEEDVQTLAKARVHFIQPGVEALATSTLKLMGKGITVFQNLLLLKHCVVHDVFPVWNLLVGFPGEDEDVYKKYIHDIPLLTHLPPPNGVFPVRFDRYSPYFSQQEAYQLKLRPSDFYTFVYPFSEGALTNIAYYFTDHNFGATYAATMARWLGPMRKQFHLWDTLWYECDQRCLPKLFFKEKDLIYDSRSGDVREHHINDQGLQILEIFKTPTRMGDLSAKLPHISAADLQDECSHLQEMGLLFQEGDKRMSLVFPCEPPPLHSFYQIKKKKMR